MPTVSGGVMTALGACAEESPPGAAEMGGLSGAAFVSLQPGLEKMRISASAWRPAAMPRIFSIFMGKVRLPEQKSGCGLL